MHSKTITTLVESQAATNKLVYELITDREVRRERDLRWDEKFQTMGTDIKTLKKGISWVLAGFLLVFIGAFANFIINGGLKLEEPPRPAISRTTK